MKKQKCCEIIAEDNIISILNDGDISIEYFTVPVTPKKTKLDQKKKKANIISEVDNSEKQVNIPG